MKNLLLFIFCMSMFFGCGSSVERQQEKRRIDSLVRAQLQQKNERQRIADSVQKAETLIADSLTHASHINAIKNSIKIISYYLSKPNSAGGIDAHFRYKNLNDKTIKYLTWEGYPINAVGDAVSCTIRGRSSFSGQDTGPIKKGQSSGYGYWECAWYNYQAKKLIITGVSIEYMDGSTFDITGDDLYIIGKKKE